MAKKKKEQYRIFHKPKYKYLSDIISLKSPEDAEYSVHRLVNQFVNARTMTKQLRILRATREAANRAKVSLRRKKLSQKERKEYKKVYVIYDTSAKKFSEQYDMIKKLREEKRKKKKKRRK